MLVLGASDSDVDGLSARSFQLRPGLLDLHIRSKPSCKSVLDQLQCLFILRNGRIQKLFLGVKAAGLEIIERQIERA